jgi:peroxiredoxin
LPQPGEKLSLVAISVDDQAASAKLATRLKRDGETPGTVILLSDPNHATIDAYGLHDPQYDGSQVDGIPRASVYLIRPDGKIAWAHVTEDYKKRPPNAEVRAAIEAMRKGGGT